MISNQPMLKRFSLTFDAIIAPPSSIDKLRQMVGTSEPYNIAQANLVIRTTIVIRSRIRDRTLRELYIQSLRIGSVVFLRKFNDFTGRRGHVPK